MILTKQQINQMSVAQKVDGAMYLQSYEICFTKSKKPYIKGMLYSKGAVPFKIWDNAKAYLYLQQNHLQGSVIQFQGVTDKYNDVMSLVIDDVSVIPESNVISYLDFLDDVYDEDVYYQVLMQTLRQYCSDNAVRVFEIVMNDADVKDSFRKEFAAVTHHDSCKNGLLAHTTKVVKLMTVLTFYEHISDVIDTDLLFISAALHDVGKCVEYYHGAMSDRGQVASHLTYGVLIVSKYEMQICALMGSDFYYQLIAVISQHHGIYGDSPRILVSYLVHLMDHLDTALTDIEMHIREDKAVGVKSPISLRDVGKINY